MEWKRQGFCVRKWKNGIDICNCCGGVCFSGIWCCSISLSGETIFRWKFEEVVKRAVRSIENILKSIGWKYMMVQSGGSHMKVFWRILCMPRYIIEKSLSIHGIRILNIMEIAGTEWNSGSRFFRTHRAYLVHFKYVQKYDANCVTMENGTALIAKQNYPEFVKQYLKYNQRKGNEIGWVG